MSAWAAVRGEAAARRAPEAVRLSVADAPPYRDAAAPRAARRVDRRDSGRTCWRRGTLGEGAWLAASAGGLSGEDSRTSAVSPAPCAVAAEPKRGFGSHRSWNNRRRRRARHYRRGSAAGAPEWGTRERRRGRQGLPRSGKNLSRPYSRGSGRHGSGWNRRPRRGRTGGPPPGAPAASEGGGLRSGRLARLAAARWLPVRAARQLWRPGAGSRRFRGDDSWRSNRRRCRGSHGAVARASGSGSAPLAESRHRSRFRICDGSMRSPGGDCPRGQSLLVTGAAFRDGHSVAR